MAEKLFYQEILFDKKEESKIQVISVSKELLKDGEKEFLEIFLRDKDGKTIYDFKEFLPEGFKFTAIKDKDTEGREEFKKFRCNAINKEIIIEPLNSPQDILAILHEIGHSHQEIKRDNEAKIIFDDTQEEQLVRLEMELEKYEDFKQKLPQSTYSKMGMDIQEKIRNVKEAIAKQAKLYIREMADIERGAWSYAVKTGKEFDLLKPFKDLKDVQDYIYNEKSLGSYESLFVKMYGKEVMGIFNHHLKKETEEMREEKKFR